jgi:hypothetical protein
MALAVLGVALDRCGRVVRPRECVRTGSPAGRAGRFPDGGRADLREPATTVAGQAGSQRQPSLSLHVIASPPPATPDSPWSLLRQSSPGW